MPKMVKKLIVVLIFVIVLKLGFVFSDESCQLTEKPRLQIVFVVAYSQNRQNNYVRFQSETARLLMKSIHIDFPDTEFSVVGFLDYPDNANPRKNARSILDP